MDDDAEGDKENQEVADKPAVADEDEGGGGVDEKKDGATTDETKKATEDDDAILTPSQEAIGIRIVRPDPKIINSMERLYAVPSEKLRVWTVWLKKVGDEASEWREWLRSRVQLAERIYSLLRVVEEGKRAEIGEEDKVKEKEASRKSKEWDVETDAEEVESPEASQSPEDPSPEADDIEVAENGNQNTNAEEGEGEPRVEAIEFEPGFWPIGERWTPKGADKKRRRLREERERAKEIPIPTTAEEMEKLVKEIRHETALFVSRYKHWVETGERAVKEMLCRAVTSTASEEEDIPYFFYLQADMDIDVALEHDDELFLQFNTRREEIHLNFEHLYFDLDERPGKSGKPWI